MQGYKWDLPVALDSSICCMDWVVLFSDCVIVFKKINTMFHLSFLRVLGVELFWTIVIGNRLALLSSLCACTIFQPCFVKSLQNARWKI